jgi:hypothetical protein
MDACASNFWTGRLGALVTAMSLIGLGCDSASTTRPETTNTVVATASSPTGSESTSSAATSTHDTLAPSGIELSAAPMDDLVDGQEIEVHATGIEEGPSGAWVLQCVATDLHRCWAGTPGTFDSFGIFTDGKAVIPVRRLVEGTDCAIARGTCVLRLARGDEASVIPNTPIVELGFEEAPAPST